MSFGFPVKLLGLPSILGETNLCQCHPVSNEDRKLSRLVTSVGHAMNTTNTSPARASIKQMHPTEPCLQFCNGSNFQHHRALSNWQLCPVLRARPSEILNQGPRVRRPKTAARAPAKKHRGAAPGQAEEGQSTSSTAGSAASGLYQRLLFLSSKNCKRTNAQLCCLNIFSKPCLFDLQRTRPLTKLPCLVDFIQPRKKGEKKKKKKKKKELSAPQRFFPGRAPLAALQLSAKGCGAAMARRSFCAKSSWSSRGTLGSLRDPGKMGA